MKRAATLENQRGVALITVMIVVALLTITVTEFTYSVQLDAYRAYNSRHALQASLLARSGINLAEGFLMLDQEPKFDSFTEDWFLQLQEFCQGLPIGDNMAIRCDVKDESGKINVNLTRGVMRRLEDQQVTADAVLRDAITCLFHNRNISSLEGGEINERLAEYWSQEPVELADGRQKQVPEFTSLEDFGAQFGLTAQELRSLRPVLTAQRRNALPTINANTAPPEVLAAVLNPEEEGCPANEAVDQIMERRNAEDGAFQNRGELSSVISGLEHPNIKQRLLGVTSSLYRLESSAIANYDPERPDDGGIGQTLSVLVTRKPDSRRRDPETGLPGWTLRAVDWQKEGGARLFWEHPAEDEEGNPEDSLDAEEDLFGG